MNHQQQQQQQYSQQQQQQQLLLQRQNPSNQYVCYSPTNSATTTAKAFPPNQGTTAVITPIQSQSRQNGNSFSPSPRDKIQNFSPSLMNNSSSTILNLTTSEPSSTKSVQMSMISNGKSNHPPINLQTSPIKQLSPSTKAGQNIQQQNANRSDIQTSPYSISSQIRILANEKPVQESQSNKNQLMRSSSTGRNAFQQQQQQQQQLQQQQQQVQMGAIKLQQNNFIPSTLNSSFQGKLIQQQQQQQQSHSSLSGSQNGAENNQLTPPIINNGIHNIVYIDQETQRKIDEQNKKFNQIFTKERGTTTSITTHNGNNFSFSQKNNLLNQSQSSASQSQISIPLYQRNSQQQQPLPVVALPAQFDNSRVIKNLSPPPKPLKQSSSSVLLNPPQQQFQFQQLPQQQQQGQQLLSTGSTLKLNTSNSSSSNSMIVQQQQHQQQQLQQQQQLLQEQVQKQTLQLQQLNSKQQITLDEPSYTKTQQTQGVTYKNKNLRSSISQLMKIDENIQKQLKGEEKFQNQNSSLTSEYIASNGSLDQTREILQERNIQNMLNTTTKLSNKVNGGIQLNQQYEQKISELQTDRSQLLKMIAAKQLEIDDLKSNLQSSDIQQVQRMDKLAKENDLLNQQNLKLASDYQVLSEKVNGNLKQMQDYAQLNEENQHLCEQAEDYREMLDKLEIKISILSNENTTLLKMIEEKQQLIEQYHSKEEEYMKNESSVMRYQDIIDKKNSQIKSLEKQLREIEEQNKVLNNEIIFQQEQFTEEKLNEAISNIVSEKNLQIDSLDTENNSLKVKIKALFEENKSMQEKLAKLGALEWYAEQLKTTKETIEENQMQKDKQLMENSDIIQEMKKIIDINKEQLEIKEKKIQQLKESYQQEKENILEETFSQLNQRLEEIKQYEIQVESLTNDIVFIKKQYIEEKKRAEYFEDHYKIQLEGQEIHRVQQEQIMLDKCLESQKSQQDKFQYLSEIEELKSKQITMNDKVEKIVSLNESLTEAVKEKSDYIQELLLEKDKLMYEREQEQLQFARIQNNLNQLEEERENFLKETQDVYALKEKVSYQEINRYKSQIEELKSQIVLKENDNNDQFQQNLLQLEQSQEEILDLKDQIHKLSMQISQMQQEGRLNQQQRIHFDSTILELQKLNENNQMELATLKDKLLKVENTRDKYYRQLNEEKEQNDLHLRKLEQNYESQIVSLDTKHKRLMEEYKYLSENYEQKKQELIQFKEELPQIASKIKNEKIELLHQVEEKDKQSNNLLLQNKVYQERILDLESQYNVLINKNDSIQNTLLAMQTQYSALENKYSQQFKKIQQLEKSNENTKSHLTISLQTAETSLSQVKMQNIELETKNKRLQDDTSRANHLKQLMKDQMEDLEINFKKEMDDIREESIKELTNKYEREKRELNFKIQKMGNQTRQLESDKDSLKQDLDAKQREIESITLQLQRLADREKNLYQQKQRLTQF